MSISFREASDIVVKPIASQRQKKREFTFSHLNPLIRVPIAQRIILVFLIPILIATIASGMIGSQSAQLLGQESGFYQNLFQGYLSLSTGNSDLELMNYKLNMMMGNSSGGSNMVMGNGGTNPSMANSTIGVIQGLESHYDVLLSDYAKKDLLIYKPEQVQLFDSAGHLGQASQQRLLTDNAQLTWQMYQRVQDQILQYIQNNQYQDAALLNYSKGVSTFDDTLNAIDQLIQFDGRLITYVQDATNIQERDELITTAIAIALIIISIGIIGALTYVTLVNRLHQLKKVARAVQMGQTDIRAIVDGRDEITDVSTSVNTMLDTIVGLLDETRVQRDAIVNAAEHLFSDLHLNNYSKLFDVKTAVNNDPIWMLGHAFKFTIDRFRRFVLRNQTTIEQLDIVSQRWQENVNTFLSNTRRLLRNVPPSQLPSGSLGNTDRTGTSTGLTPSQLQEHIHLTEGFAREATKFAQSLRRIMEEMHANLVLFHPDTLQSNQQSNSARRISSHGDSQRIDSIGITAVRQSLDPSKQRNSLEIQGINLSDDRYKSRVTTHEVRLRKRAGSDKLKA